MYWIHIQVTKELKVAQWNCLESRFRTEERKVGVNQTLLINQSCKSSGLFYPCSAPQTVHSHRYCKSNPGIKTGRWNLECGSQYHSSQNEHPIQDCDIPITIIHSVSNIILAGVGGSGNCFLTITRHSELSVPFCPIKYLSDFESLVDLSEIPSPELSSRLTLTSNSETFLHVAYGLSYLLELPRKNHSTTVNSIDFQTLNFIPSTTRSISISLPGKPYLPAVEAFFTLLLI